VPIPPPNPFVITATVAPSGDGYGVLIDGRPLRTPSGAAMVVPSEKLAAAIAEEWCRAGARPRADAIPLTRVAATALDRFGSTRGAIEEQLLAYAETELLCHRAESPPELVSREHAAWQPLLDWLARRHDALLHAASGVMAKPQDAAALAALKKAVTGLDSWRCAALSVAVAASGSLVIGLALVDGHIDAAAAFDAAELDATFQIEKWGEDSEATTRRRGVRAELDLAARFLGLLD
jgi:chaperone required for assembly of F1-ATPase